jgi:citrate lyase subunit beta/citryl-CoA lyase
MNGVMTLAPDHLVAPLFVPGDRPERFAKAVSAGAQCVVLDLEDAVAPDDKARARDCVAQHGIDAVPVLVRINAVGTPWFDDDLSMLREARLSGLMIPKAASAKMVDEVVARTGVQAIVPLVESAAGLGNLSALLRARHVVAAAFGSIDLAADLGCDGDWESLLAARSELVLRSKLAGVAPPVDGITVAVDDASLVTEQAKRARSLGFRGKLAIHPKQLEAIRSAFRATAAERSWADRVLAAVERDPRGALTVDGCLVDRPMIERARRIAEEAKR